MGCWNILLCAPLAGSCPTTQLMSSCCWEEGGHGIGAHIRGSPQGLINILARTSATALSPVLGDAEYFINNNVSTLLNVFLLLSAPGWFFENSDDQRRGKNCRCNPACPFWRVSSTVILVMMSPTFRSWTRGHGRQRVRSPSTAAATAGVK